MKQLIPSSSFKKDLKRYQNDRKKLEQLYEVLDYLRRGERLPKQYKTHMLIGQYKGCLECHISGDYLLIWFDETADIISLVRLGSHSELF